MPSKALVTVVEGHGEVESAPLIIRRLIIERSIPSINIATPFRSKRHLIIRDGHLEKVITTILTVRENCGGILILLDADDDCPAQLGTSLQTRAQKVTSVPIRVVVANKELEAWFLGAKESLRGVRGIKHNATTPVHPEEIRGAKEHLTENMSEGRSYLEVDDQPAFAEKFDWRISQQVCPSFDKFVRSLDWLFDRISSAPA